MLVYTVKQGDTLTSIALSHGFRSWKELYKDPSNAAFHSSHPNPNHIVPGDQINIPPISYRMAIIDGTGPSDNGEYNPAMQNSFCRQLATSLGGNAKYIRGPGPAGIALRNEAKEAHSFLYANRNKPGVRLMLAGYSRGGSAAIMASKLLENDGIEVDSLFLFDAVARHHYPGGEVIPANVQFSRHARRDLEAYMIVKYEGTFADAWYLPNASNPMRPTFGNTGLTWIGDDGDHEIAKPFRGSHGALGGVGWSFVAEDAACQMQVAKWMNEHLKSRGVWHELRSQGTAPSPRAVPSKTALITGIALDAILYSKHEKNLSRAGRIR